MAASRYRHRHADGVPALYARTTSLRAIEVWGFTFASMLLGWPFLWIATVIVRYWITGEPVGE